jgi:hypothetical protein
MNIPIKCGYAQAEARPDSKSSGMKSVYSFEGTNLSDKGHESVPFVVSCQKTGT